MAKNKAASTHVTPAVQAKGNGTPPKIATNNVTGSHTSVHVKLGAGQKDSQFAKTRASGGTGGNGGKQNLPTKNSPTKSVPLGTTKHAVGEVPAYLKRSK